MSYAHTQRGKLQWLLWGAALFCVVFSWFAWTEERCAAFLLLGCAGMLVLLVFSFSTLTVRDEGDALAIRFGPLPFWSRRIAYARIGDPRPARSKLIDGWGIHWAWGRGWTWNLWTFDCVEMTVDGKPFRVGTDDKERLAAFLRERAGRGA